MAVMTDSTCRHAEFNLATNTALSDFPNVEAKSVEQRNCLKQVVALLFTSYRFPLSERLEQAIVPKLWLSTLHKYIIFSGPSFSHVQFIILQSCFKRLFLCRELFIFVNHLTILGYQTHHPE